MPFRVHFSQDFLKLVYSKLLNIENVENKSVIFVNRKEGGKPVNQRGFSAAIEYIKKNSTFRRNTSQKHSPATPMLAGSERSSFSSRPSTIKPIDNKQGKVLTASSFKRQSTMLKQTIKSYRLTDKIRSSAEVSPLSRNVLVKSFTTKEEQPTLKISTSNLSNKNTIDRVKSEVLPNGVSFLWRCFGKKGIKINSQMSRNAKIILAQKEESLQIEINKKYIEIASIHAKVGSMTRNSLRRHRIDPQIKFDKQGSNLFTHINRQGAIKLNLPDHIMKKNSEYAISISLPGTEDNSNNMGYSSQLHPAVSTERNRLFQESVDTQRGSIIPSTPPSAKQRLIHPEEEDYDSNLQDEALIRKFSSPRDLTPYYFRANEGQRHLIQTDKRNLNTEKVIK